MVFVTDSYTEDQIDQIDFHALYEGLFEKVPFDTKQEHFNAYVVKTDEVNEGEFANLFSLIDNECEISFEQIDQVVMISGANGRSHASFDGIQITYGHTSVNTFIHEGGHSFGMLADEYYHMEDRTYSKFGTGAGLPEYKNVNADFPGCKDWCSGDLNVESEGYKYYQGWKDCVEPFRASSYKFDSELLLCFDQWSLKRRVYGWLD